MKKHFYGTEWDWRHYEAVRDSKLPRYCFDEARADWWVLVAMVACAVVGLMVTL